LLNLDEQNNKQKNICQKGLEQQTSGYWQNVQGDAVFDLGSAEYYGLGLIRR